MKLFPRVAALCTSAVLLAPLFHMPALAQTPLAQEPPNASSPSAPVPNASTPKEAPIKIGGPEANIRRLLQARLKPGVQIGEIVKTPYFGLYEVPIGSSLLYTDEKVTYVIDGEVLDGKTWDNLTERRIDQLSAVKFGDLPLQDAMKMVNGTGKRQLAYFTDPNCPYCKQLEHTLTQLKDTTVYVFLYPILSEDSVVKARALWCAEDKVKAWNDWMLRGRMVSNAGTCDNPIASNRALGQRLHVKATPTMILANGLRIPGAMSVAELEKALADPGK
jgi:thiol:disulfide interchange protein DsbC